MSELASAERVLALDRHAPLVAGLLPHELWPPHCAAALRIAYRSRGRTTSGLILLPSGRAPRGRWPIMTWGHCLTGLSRGTAPTVIGPTRRERKHLGDWLSRGFAVVVADYWGLDGWALNTFPVSAPLAADLLDIACAAVDLGLPVSNRVVVAGFSQGAGVALEAGARWHGWSDRLELCGTVALAPVEWDDFYRAALHLGRAQVEQTTPLIVAAAAFHDPHRQLHRHLTELGRRAVALAHTVSVAEVGRFVTGWRNRDLGFSALLRHGGLDDIFARSSPPLRGYDRPVLLCATSPDPMAPKSSVLTFARRLRRCGSPVTVFDYLGRGHLTVVESASADVVDWAHALVS